ncbi:MAG TPA: metallophosphoesterase [Lacunisphaera sp.]|jgi:predicted phosphodiesterase|nr:metallophosphoesterase [Lacunisphaera sp.]
MLRILSDLHLFDARTLVRDLAQLEPLLAGVETLVLNGDTCEMRRGVTAANLAAMQAYFRARVPRVVFVTGNHDPDISETHELMLADDRIWVTHGDVCFDDLTPWARQRDVLARQVAEVIAEMPGADYAKLDVRIRVAREVARRESHFPDRTTRSWAAHLAWTWHTFFPPRQPLAMLRSWRDLPGRAAALAAGQRPSVQVVVMGHVHFPGIWRLQPIVINTGSFFSPLGGNLVDVEEARVCVRKIARQGRDFAPGRTVGEIQLR